MTLFCGIDGGKRGAIAMLDEKQEIILLIPMPVVEVGSSIEYDLGGIAKIFEDLPDEIKIYLERSYMLPRNGCKQNYNIGWNMGAMEGILSAFNLSYEIVAPQLWQKSLFQGITITDTKEASIMFCKKKWPKQSLRIGTSMKESDGMADALMIALFCWRHNNEKTNN